MRLDVSLVDGLAVVLPLYDQVCVGESLLYIPQLVLVVVGDIADSVGRLPQRLGLQIVVEQRRVVFHRLRGREHPRQDLVDHLDQVRGLLGYVRTGGRHRSHSVTNV